MLRQSLLRLPRAATGRYALPSIPARSLSTGSVDSWIADMKSRPPHVDVDTILAERATQLLRTLPLQQNDMAAGSGSDAAAGGKLPKGHNLIYWQPEDFLDNLAADGTSTVSGQAEVWSRGRTSKDNIHDAAPDMERVQLERASWFTT